MDEKSIRMLELPLILERLARYCAFSGSRELALALEPETDFRATAVRQAETSEARRLLENHSEASVDGAQDLRPQVESAVRGALLEPQDLLDIKSTLIAARNLRRLMDEESGQLPHLARIAAMLNSGPGLIDRITHTVDDHGEVLDSASQALAELRRDLRTARERLAAKLQRLVSNPQLAPMLQEPIVTQREGRYVVPLRAEFKGRIKGIVHDQSSSGATLFIEPLQTVELNNQVRELELAERDEIRRVLAALSAQIGEHAHSIQETVQSLSEFDLALAKARYAEALQASEPSLLPPPDDDADDREAPVLRLLKARHPLLDPESVIPIDLVLEKGIRALVITGPNTGGKTVTLKTAGLLALMAACGLHIPVQSGSELSLFEGIFADIGDEQSIEQSLSTFSGHIANITRILEQAGERSLVLLDELGAGTDPQEGAALGRALLSELLERGCTTLVATHYSDLKTFAHLTPGVVNASVEFDLETLEPTYHLTIGLPGRSNALAIAARLGLDGRVVERARDYLSAETLESDDLLEEMYRQRDELRQARAAAQANERALRERADQLEARLAGMEAERRRMMEQARRELDDLLEAIRGLRRRLDKAGQPVEVVEEIAQQAQALAEALPPKPESPPMKPLKPGDSVHVRSIDAEGIVESVGDGKIEVRIGELRVKAQRGDVEPLESRSLAGRPKRATASRRSSAKAAVASPPLEIDLRGQTADEALIELDRRLDAAYLAGMPFLRIIHGKGTGKLRKVIREALRGNRYVASFEPGGPSEGGEGVTVVHLATD